jgi:ATP/maltotriose-dependent transcriptional regulator MalT
VSTSSPILTTKLYIPPARAILVPRARLTARLDEGLSHSLTLFSAPAGFGKTPLMSEWRVLETGRGFPLTRLSLGGDV